jgi:hypothetical protein
MSPRRIKASQSLRILSRTVMALGLTLGVAAAVVPETASGFVAGVTNSQNTSTTAPYFTCRAAAASVGAANTEFSFGLNDPAGSSWARDLSGNNLIGTYFGSMRSTPSPSACPRDPGGAYTLDGRTSGFRADNFFLAPLNTFSIELWFNTSVGGGNLISFGNRQGPAFSTRHDRHVWLSDDGRLSFGVYPGTVRVISSSASYLDGAWHHAVASLSSNGMALYVDGIAVATDPSTTTAEQFLGYWRVGNETLNNWGPLTPSNYLYTGQLRFASVYSVALTPEQITSHYRAGR